ncbi:MAG: Uma2 family endonuclease [Armatimonadetes bacterium]|nr:Uma2 family endonuclease [Armatimonadota bacterium]
MTLASPTPSPPASPPRPCMTADEFLEFCRNEKHLELVRGAVIQLSPSGIVHNQIESHASDLLKAFVMPRKLGVVWTGDAGFILERDPFTVRSPDLSFVRQERFEPVKHLEGFFPGAPDFAVEILSPTDSLKATEAKAQMYLRTGCSVVWILNPADFTLRIYRVGEAVRVLGLDDEADAEPVLPGFRCPVRDLFGLPSEPQP